VKSYALILLVYFLACTSFVFPQKDDAVLSGFVTDATTGEILVGTNILLYKDSLTVTIPHFRGTSTNNFGFYAIPSLPLGRYILVVRNIGYKTFIDEVLVTISTGTVRLNIQLNVENIKLGEVVVTGEREDKGKVSTIDIAPEILSRLPSLSGEVDLFRSLELLPGVKVSSELSSGLYIRGGSPDQTLTLVDGIIVYNPAHLGNFTSTFNTNAVQNVRLIKGAVPAEYGGRLSSVLDIKLRSGTKEKNKGSLSIGTVNSSLFLEGPLSEKSTYMLSGRKMYYDVFQDAFDENSTTPRYNYYDVNSKITLNLGETDIVSISGMLNHDRIYSPPNIPYDDYNIEWQNGTLGLNWLHVNPNSLLLSSSINYIDYRFKSIINQNAESVNSTGYYSDSKLRDLYAKFNAELNWHPDHTIKVGTELALHNYDLIYNDYYDELLEQNLYQQTDLIATEASLYLQDEWEIFPFLITNFGGRLYYFKSKQYLKIEPRFSLSYYLTENFIIKTAYATAHQFLHLIVRNDISLPTDLWYPSSSVIEPNKSTQYVLGVDSYFDNQSYLLSIEGYYKDIKNLYEFKNAAQAKIDEPIESLFTKGEGEAYGIEFFLNKREGDFAGWIGYTLSWTRRVFDELNNGKIFYPRYDRRHDFSLVVTYNATENLSFGLTWAYATGQGYSLPSGQYEFQGIGFDNSKNLQFNYPQRNDFRLPSYHKLDLSGSYKFTWLSLPCEVYVSLLNVYNRKNPFAYYVTSDNNSNSSSTSYSSPVVNMITLFPFIPSVGFNVKF
jgi:outer membrane receptor for ferrienterochelin and colicin